MKKFNDNNLIFLISLPRSGSSLLQQLIVKSPDVSSTPEPWIMLQLISIYKDFKIDEIYSPATAVLAVNEFISNSNLGIGYLKEKIKEIAFAYYNSHSEGNAKFFLDKTPRYYHIIDELEELFPNSKKIILLRNPAAVFISMYTTFFNNNLKNLLKSKSHLFDLFEGPKLISNSIEKYSNNKNFFFLKYEDLTEKKDNILTDLYDFLSLSAQNLNFNYSVSEKFQKSILGDPKVKQKSQIENNSLKWIEKINNFQTKKILEEYINIIDEKTLKTLGYNKNETLKLINSIKITKSKFFPLEYFIDEYYKLSFRKHLKFKIIEKFK